MQKSFEYFILNYIIYNFYRYSLFVISQKLLDDVYNLIIIILFYKKGMEKISKIMQNNGDYSAIWSLAIMVPNNMQWPRSSWFQFFFCSACWPERSFRSVLPINCQNYLFIYYFLRQTSEASTNTATALTPMDASMKLGGSSNDYGVRTERA